MWPGWNPLEITSEVAAMGIEATPLPRHNHRGGPDYTMYIHVHVHLYVYCCPDTRTLRVPYAYWCQWLIWYGLCSCDSNNYDLDSEFGLWQKGRMSPCIIVV